jgi:hypothetical protein
VRVRISDCWPYENLFSQSCERARRMYNWRVLGIHRTGPRLVVKTFPVEARLFKHRWLFLVEKGL